MERSKNKCPLCFAHNSRIVTITEEGDFCIDCLEDVIEFAQKQNWMVQDNGEWLFTNDKYYKRSIKKLREKYYCTRVAKNSYLSSSGEVISVSVSRLESARKRVEARQKRKKSDAFVILWGGHGAGKNLSPYQRSGI